MLSNSTIRKFIDSVLSVLSVILLSMLISCSGEKSADISSENLYGPGKNEPYPVKKDTVFRVNGLSSGSVKTESGWKVQDFAHSFYNPNSDTISIYLRMVSDDPGFVFSNGQTGTFTKTYLLKPMFGITDNVFIAPPFEKYSPNWPVKAGTWFTGSVEFRSSKPFYYYMLHSTSLSEAKDMSDAYFAGWDPSCYDEAGAWDPELDRFIIPYTNYWHNCVSWVVGWNSTLIIRNNSGTDVNYTIRHVPFYGAQYNAENGWITRFVEQVVIIPLKNNEEKKIPLTELYGWSTTQTASLEGCLLIFPDKKEAKEKGTVLSLLIVPNESGKALHEAIP
jgi:hypothetical protein